MTPTSDEQQKNGPVVDSSVIRHVLPLVISVLVGIGSAATTATITTAKLEERVNNIERKLSDHAQETTGLRQRDNEYERRISRAETLAEETQRRLSEIGADVKALIKMEKMKP